jgi:predicted GIY-YIG superfamily endonuclease
MSNKPHVLYRMFDANEQLLYIGLTNNPKGRFGRHRDTKDWFAQVSRIQLEIFDSRQELVDAERAAIAAEKPLHNIVHNREALAEQEEAEFFEEEDYEDRLMGVALSRLITEEQYGAKRTPEESLAAYAQFVSEAREVLR